MEKRINAEEAQYNITWLFGEEVLYTKSRIDPHTLPVGWNVYDMSIDRGQKQLSLYAADDFIGCILSSKPVKLYGKNSVRKIPDGKLETCVGLTTLQDYCRSKGLPYTPANISISAPADKEDIDMFYALSEGDPRLKARLGHERMYFDGDKSTLWHTWFMQEDNRSLCDDEFKKDANMVGDRLMRLVLKDLRKMRSYCYTNGTLIAENSFSSVYGFVIETVKYKYYLRCTPARGDYNAYLNCFRKDLL